MKNLWSFCFLCVLSHSTWADIAVVVNPANSNQLNTDQVAKIYLGKMKGYPDGKTAIPVDQTPGSPLRKDFLSKVVKKSESQYKSYWSSIIFTGKGVPPQILDSDKTVKELVSRNLDAIGFISASEVDASVKVVGSF